ncbi:hypothetical protein NC651_007555 [Populus alba x Populus x berolinensis]|nr:hypothetical protein NC651_007555 [Populus alba x Populus x berolinensis]
MASSMAIRLSPPPQMLHPLFSKNPDTPSFSSSSSSSPVLPQPAHYNHNQPIQNQQYPPPNQQNYPNQGYAYPDQGGYPQQQHQYQNPNQRIKIIPSTKTLGYPQQKKTDQWTSRVVPESRRQDLNVNFSASANANNVQLLLPSIQTLINVPMLRSKLPATAPPPSVYDLERLCQEEFLPQTAKRFDSVSFATFRL